MKDAGELFVDAIEHWRENKGIGTALIPAPLNDKVMVLGVLQRIYARSPTCHTVIITTTFNERIDIIEFLTTQEDSDENNQEFKSLLDKGNIKVFTEAYVSKMQLINFPLLCILYRPETLSGEIFYYISRCKFRLIVLNKFVPDAEFMNNVYKLAPLLNDFKQAEIEQIRLSSPVEETRVSIDMPENSEEFKLLKRYNEYVTTSVTIFGSFDILKQANVGNMDLNISSTQICNQIAQENGWNEHLDMNIPFNVEIDNLYNPNALRERASQTYEIIRKRNNLLSDYNGKLDAIDEIVQSNKDKKILIINKRAEFASKVTLYLNTMSNKDICMNYHDKVEPINAVDDAGNPVYYKTGVKKGERKTLAAKAQKTLAIKLFNKGVINILSTNNAPDKDLDIDVDIIIITSPMCEDIKSYIYRLSNIRFNENKVVLYSLYCKNTNEEKLIENKERGANHDVKNSCDDENNYDFIVVD